MRPNQQRMPAMAASHSLPSISPLEKERHDRTATAASEHDAPVQSNSPREAVPTFSPANDITSPEYFFVHSKHACVARLTFLKPSLADAEKDQTSVKPNA